MNIAQIEASIKKYALLEYMHSSGPGGQNVNKLATKVRLRINIENIDGISDAESQNIKKRLANRLTNDNELLLTCDSERNQARNEKLAFVRLLKLITQAAAIQKSRIPTKPTKKSVEARLDTKRKKSNKKKLRSIITDLK